jgi:hypothetical protein
MLTTQWAVPDATPMLKLKNGALKREWTWETTPTAILLQSVRKGVFWYAEVPKQ